MFSFRVLLVGLIAAGPLATVAVGVPQVTALRGRGEQVSEVATREMSRQLFYMPPDSEERLKVASAAYTVWTQSFMSAVAEESGAAFWRDFLGLGIPLAEAYKLSGYTAWDNANYYEAVPLLQAAYALAPDDPELQARLGLALKDTGLYEQGVPLLEKAVNSAEPNPYWWVWYGDGLRLLGRYAESVEAMETAVAMSSGTQQEELKPYVGYSQRLASDTPSWEAFMLHREFADRHAQNRRTRRVIAQYERALELKPLENGEVSLNDALLREAWTYLQIAVNYAYLKQAETSIPYYLRAYALYQQAEDAIDMARCANGLADALRLLADRDTGDETFLLDLALVWRTRAIEAVERSGDATYHRLLIGRNLSDLVARYGTEAPEVQPVRDRVSKEVPMRGPIDSYDMAGVLQGEIDARYHEGDYSGARVLLEILLPYLDGATYLEDTERAAQNYAMLADIYLWQERPESALEAVAKGQERLGIARQFLDADAYFRSPARKSLRLLAAVAVAARLQQGQFEEALQAADSYALRTRVELLGTNATDEGAFSDSDIERTLIPKRLAFIDRLLGEVPDPTFEVLLTQVRTQEVERLAWLERGIKFEEATVANYTEVPQQAPKFVLEQWPATDTLLQYIVGARVTPVVVVQNGAARGQILPIGDAALRRAVTAWHTTAATGTDAQAELGALSEALFVPVRGELSTETVTIIPDNVLAYVPFEAMPMDDTVLGAAKPLAYASSASSALFTRQNGGAPSGSLLALDRLGRDPADWFGAYSPAEIFTGDAATEARAASTPADVLYVAAQAHFGQFNVMLNRVDLAPSGDDDGLWHAAEMLYMRNLPDTIVFDAESIDARALIDGKAIEGLAEALTRAGVRHFIINRWAVPADAAAVFARTFFEALPAQGARAAVQTAQQAVRGQFPSPAAWAAFALRGGF